MFLVNLVTFCEYFCGNVKFYWFSALILDKNLLPSDFGNHIQQVGVLCLQIDNGSFFFIYWFWLLI